MTVVERAPVDATRVQQLTGVQALPRIFVAQHARDAAAGLRTAGFVSGYQGSPLGGVDAAFARDRDVAAADVRFLAGLNEELAATAVWGTQTPLRDRKRRVDGVVGMWFGKAPGLDRACDAIRHGNNLGADPRGGVLLAVGDDPAAKSSTLPCASEKTLAALHVPVLFPGNGADIVALGEYGIALSRATGFWVALKIVTDVADGLWEVPDVDAARPVISAPAFEWNGSPWRHQQRPLASMPHAGRAEGDIAGPRRAALEQFLAANPIDVVEVDPHDASMAIVAAGKTFHDTAQALADLGLGRAELERNGIRLLNVSLPWPLQAAPLLEATRGVDTVVVVEEKLPFIETQVRDLLYRSPHRPSVVGERDHEGRALVPCDGELTASRISAALRRVLAGRVDLPPVQPERVRIPVITTERQAFFCSGCPHNRSTTVPDGSLVGAGIGCHGMAARMPHVNQQITGITHMGGEGAQWIGQSEYFDVDHIFQNVGDGTYFHSAQLAVQACVASGVNITFKLLFNGAVAMTGGQDVLGARSVPDLTHKLKAEGVTRIVVLTDELHRYGRRSGVAPGTDVWDRSRLEQAQLELRETPGVTVLVYDQQCAAEARRLRKRGLQPTRPERVVINERICEGCGDCGVKSNCLSVEPVDTEFGRKTRIAQDSCNEDYSCLDGDCPSFMMVEVDGARPASSTAAPPPVPDPVIPTIDGTYNVLLAGIGGTGIVTVNRILAAAAERDGLRAHGLDQTGLSQKAGPVTSHLRLETSSTGTANRLSPNSTDCFLGFDVLVAAGDVCADYLSTERTHAFVSTSKVPTGEMVRDPSVSFPPLPDLQAAVAPKVTDVVWLDILAAAETLCGSTQTANLMLVGAAVQAGALPISPSAIEAAIEQNGVAVDANRLAFTWGRVAIADPVAFAAASAPATTALDRSAVVGEAMIGQVSGLTGELRRLAALRAGELVAFGNRRVARRYLDTVEAAATAEATLGEGREYATAVARSLHHVIAVKDEYEVARLMTDADVLAELDRQYPDAKSVHLLLHPPVLRSLGRQKKIRVSRRLFPAFKVLAAGKRLRGTPLDVFGLTRVRRLERTVRDEHWALVERLTATLDAANHADAVAAASAADVIRGYEDIKVRNVARYHEILENLGVRQPVAIAEAQTDHTVGSPTPSPESPRPRP